MRQTREHLDRLRIAAPCPASWERMAGDERVRHCTLCDLNVYNFAEMTRDEVRELLERTEGRVCARLYRRADGTVITRDCPTGLRALHRRTSRFIAAAVALMLSAPIAFGEPFWKRVRNSQRSTIKLDVTRAASSQPAMFAGVVHDRDGSPLPGVTITVRDEASDREVAVVSAVDGTFQIASLDDGLYRVEVALSGFRTAKLERLQLKAEEVTHASVALRFDTSCTITVGAIAPALSNDSSVSMTFTQDLVNKLPL